MSIHPNVWSRVRPVWPVLVIVALVTVGCASAGRSAARSAAAGDWDTAVEYYQRALQDHPGRPEYRISLERARINASRAHIDAGRAFEERQELSAALREYRAAAQYDASNSEVAARAATLDRAIRARIDAARPPPPIEAMRAQAGRETAPPLLNPASRDPLVFDFRETSLQDLIDFIGDATGINVSYDEEFQDREVTIRIDGLTLEEALDHVLSINQSFYKVLNPRAIIVIPETLQKRAQYAEQVIRTFYVSHADVQELSQLLSQIVRAPQMAVQPAVIPNTVANTITVRATTEVAAIIEQVIAANDKPLAEVIIDVVILEVNRERARRYGLNLSDYALGGIFSPELAPPNEAIAPSGVGSSPPVQSQHHFPGRQHRRFLSGGAGCRRPFPGDGFEHQAGGETAAARARRHHDDPRAGRGYPGSGDRLHRDRRRGRGGQPPDVVQLPTRRDQRHDDPQGDLRERDHPRPDCGEQHPRRQYRRGRYLVAHVRVQECGDAVAPARRRVQPAGRAAAGRGPDDVAWLPGNDEGPVAAQALRRQRRSGSTNRHRHAADTADRPDPRVDAARRQPDSHRDPDELRTHGTAPVDRPAAGRRCPGHA